MGMFDSVNFHCPVCGKHIDVQSKAGECDLKDYDRSEVPIKIASDINGDQIVCSGCNSLLEVSSHLGEYVPMYLHILSVGLKNSDEND